MSAFQGFVFKNPETKLEQTKQGDDGSDISNLSVRFSQITADDDQDHSRLSDFRSLRSPLNSRTKSETQEKRRLKALELQKSQRNISISKARQLALGFNGEADSEDEEEEEEEEDEEEDEEEEYTSHKRRRDSDNDVVMQDSKLKKIDLEHTKKNKKKNLYANQIMYAETMEMIPEDFTENWIMLICPKGKRCLVTSGGGYTIARSRGGHTINKFQSILPNGSRSRRSNDFCILDCVYDAVHWTFYVLDIMCWKGYSIFDCDTNFRHFWLQTKIEAGEFDRPNGENQFYKFVAVKPLHITDDFTQIVQNPREYINQYQQLDYEIDGLLFYHKETHYKGGSTPLVCWVPNDNISTFLQQ